MGLFFPAHSSVSPFSLTVGQLVYLSHRPKGTHTHAYIQTYRYTCLYILYIRPLHASHLPLETFSNLCWGLKLSVVNFSNMSNSS